MAPAVEPTSVHFGVHHVPVADPLAVIVFTTWTPLGGAPIAVRLPVALRRHLACSLTGFTRG
jgi:hypothetical protein